MKKTLLFAAQMFVSIALTAQVMQKNVTTIQLRDSVGANVSFFYADQFNDTDPPFFLSDKQTAKNIELTSPVLLFNANSGIPHYVKPGESLLVTQVDKRVELLSPSPERTNELNFFIRFDKVYPDFFKTNASVRMKQAIRSAVYSAVEKNEAEKQKQGLDFLEKYRRTNPVSDEFYIYAQRFFYYLKSANLFSILGSPTIQIRDRPTFDDTRKITDAYTFYCDSCVDDMIYRVSAYNYLQYLVRSRIRSDDHRYSKGIYYLIDSSFQGKTKEFLLFVTLKEQLKYGTNPDSEYLSIYTNNENEYNRQYVGYIKKEIRFRESKNKKNELIGVNKEAVSLDELLTRFRGKIVLLDFWASWCIPCRKTMPETRKLAVEHSQLQVLYISTDEKYNDWQKALKAEHLDTSVYSFVIANYQSSEIKKRFNIQSIPRYVLIDKTGDIIAADSPHPGSVALNELIRRYSDR